MSTQEVNFDGLVGPTHNYAGLSFGNVASAKHKALVSSPRKAALQGLKKMRALYELGIPQGVLPPQERPHIPTLRKLGLTGSDAQIWEASWKKIPEQAAACCSASSMWVANAATISPAADCNDGKTHITPANLVSMAHRNMEAPVTTTILSTIFSDSNYFEVHAALDNIAEMGDEGAANHTRFCAEYGDAGVELFVYGVDQNNPGQGPQRYPARQTLQASQTIARHHQLGNRAIFAQQNPAVIDAGVFHNDVIAVGNLNLLFFHELAFQQTEAMLEQLQNGLAQTELRSICVPEQQVSVSDAVNSYLFNSQLVNTEHGQVLIAPSECEQTDSVRNYLNELTSTDAGIAKVHYFDLRESMRNGGGPACLRLRVVLNEVEQDSLGANVLYSPALHQQLEDWVNNHYRESLAPADLADPHLIQETRTALDELSQILTLGNPYEFQQ